MSSNLIAVVALTQILNILIILLAWRFLKPRLMGFKGDLGAPGPQGAKGERGLPGKSAYELAVDSGFEGSLKDWLNVLENKNK
jgi:hypothetical protein